MSLSQSSKADNNCNNGVTNQAVRLFTSNISLDDSLR